MSQFFIPEQPLSDPVLALCLLCPRMNRYLLSSFYIPRNLLCCWSLSCAHGARKEMEHRGLTSASLSSATLPASVTHSRPPSTAAPTSQHVSPTQHHEPSFQSIFSL